MRVRVIAFARLRELLGDEHSIELPEGADAGALWSALAAMVPDIAPLQGGTRVACNGRVTAWDAVLASGDEVALLPPVGGG